MIELEQKINLPGVVKSYYFVKMAFLTFLAALSFSMVLGYFLLWWILLVIFLGVPILLYIVLVVNNTSFVVGQNTITINSGIIYKRSKSIPFANVQNVENMTGILSGVFRLSRINIWTASPLQTQIGEHTQYGPDGFLFLTAEDANWLRKFILDNETTD